MTVSEAATALGVAPQTIRYRLLNGIMHGQRLTPRMWLIPRREVERARALGPLKPGRKPQSAA